MTAKNIKLHNTLRQTFRRAALASLLGLSLSAAIGLGSALTGSIAVAQAQVTAPDELIKSLSAKVLDQIKSDKDIQAGNFKRISEFIDTTIMPNVNFERMTSLSVGRGWRQATPEQQKRLITEFRTLLVRTYSGALTQFRDQTVRVKPLRAEAADTEVIVRSEVVPKRGEAVQLDYRMEKTDSGWKIYDVNIASLWLVDSYRNQFGQEINAKGVEGLIASLTAKNKQFETEGKK